MLDKIASGVLLFALLALASPGITAQTSQPNGAGNNATTPPPAKAAGKTETLTGCVQRGDPETRYTLASQDGGVWDLESNAVKLSSHLNHTVTVTGTVVEPFKTKPRKQDAPAHENRRGILSVSKLTMVSTSCAQ